MLARLSLLAASLMLAGVACAQDTRTVTEPVIPKVCVKLAAVLGKSLTDADEAKLDTKRIQEAMDHCPAKQAGQLAPDAGNSSFLTGPLELRAGVTLLVDEGVTLYGSRDPKVYEFEKGSCGVVSDAPRGCKPLITAKEAKSSAIMGDGVIDARGGAKILGSGKSWWDLANDARGGGRQQCPRLLETDRTDDFTLYRITLKNSPNFHVVFAHGDGFTIWGLKIDTPENARNTDGVDPSASKNITMTHSYIRDGDDNIAIKGGNGPVTNMTVIHNHFYWGHGMSIGSETNAGVSKVLVQDLSLDGTTAGIRIKTNPTRGGLVQNITYDDLCIRNSKNPIQLDTAYNNPGNVQDGFPVYKDILVHNTRIISGKAVSLNGFDHTHRIGIQFDGVMLDNPTGYKITGEHADVTLGPGPVNFHLTGVDSTERGQSGKGTLESCKDKFVPFPVK